MADLPSTTAPSTFERRLVSGLFVALLVFNVWGVSVGWKNVNLPGCEFRQAQTALSALFIQRDHDFSLAYPTPVLGKPWSVPMEFPLYQWTVVLVSNATGLSLTSAARTVSALCFYLALPAFYLLFRRLGLNRTQRLIALGFILTCPLYIFYARSFMIETMALMGGVWYLVALLEVRAKRSWSWAAWCVVAGTLAGLVKVTTFILFLIPAFVWSVIWLWQARPHGTDRSWRPLLRTLGWLAGVHVVPFAAAHWWVGFSDAVKMLNPSGEALTSFNLVGWNFGVGHRFDPEVWAAHWRIFFRELISPINAVLCLPAAFFIGRRWWLMSVIAVGLFLTVQLIFPILYAWHEYYYVANAFALMAALASIVLGLLDSKSFPRSAAVAVLAVAYGCQILLWHRVHYPEQFFAGIGGDDLNSLIRDITEPDEALVVAGQDWNSMMPYYSQRRTLMLRDDIMRSPEKFDAAFAEMKGTPVAALILRDTSRGSRGVLQRAAKYLGIDERQALDWKGDQIFLNRDIRTEVLAKIESQGINRFYGAVLAPAAAVRDRPLANKVVTYSGLLARNRKLFRNMHPAPTSFFSTVGPELWDEVGEQRFFAHPDTKLWFALGPGNYRLRTNITMTVSSYTGVSRTDASDGVSVVATLIDRNGERQEVHRQHLNPRDNEADRGVLSIDWPFSLSAEGQLELAVLPGPAGNSARDWATLGTLRIEPENPPK